MEAAGVLKHFQAGGAVREGSLYVERAADRELFAALSRGEPCHVLATTQTGKSSLKLHVARKLEEAGVRCARLELTGGVTEEQWYYGLARNIAREAKIEVDPDGFWDRDPRLSQAQRWTAFVREELLTRVQGRLVVFLDEINVVLGLEFPTEPFFAALREVQDARAADARYNDLTFCVLGIAFPEALMKDAARTPFRGSRAVVVGDFEREEMAAFAPGLGVGGEEVSSLLDEVFAWTHGHPYMT
ncbi:MAG: AAA-like domain-containing protein, partial [Byssovorax sp.]